MIAIDTNMLIHLLVKSQKEHSQVIKWFKGNREALVLTHINVAEFLRLLTHPRVFPSPLLLDAAVDLLEEFFQSTGARVLEEAENWWLGLKDLVKEIPNLKGNEVFDAQIALCLRHHGVKKILTMDSDFLKYPFLKVIKL